MHWSEQVAKGRGTGDWSAIAMTLVGIPALLAAGCVWALVSVAGSVTGAVAELVSCSDEDQRFAERLTDDPALSALEERFPQHRSAQYACDPDDGTASADLRLRTDLPIRETRSEVGSLMESHGWRSEEVVSGGCFTKVIEGRAVWADVAVNGRRVDQPESHIELMLVTANYCRF